MPSHPLTPAQALWQHFNPAPREDQTPSLSRAHPVSQKDLYSRLQQIGRQTTRTPDLTHLATGMSATGTNWQSATRAKEADEGLGLSEL